MKLIKSKNANINYLAKIVEINEFHPHSDPEVTKLKCAYVDGYNIIVGIDSKPGKYVYFPTSSTINPQFLSFANLYRHGQLNSNPEQTGMFEDNGRVKAIKLRGVISEGFLLPIQILLDWIVDSVNQEIPDSELINGLEFDSVEHNGKQFWVNKKYIVEKRISNNSQSRYNRRQKNIKRFDRIIDTQFRLHYDTVQLRKCPNAIDPNDLISITSKWNGTSHISAYVLTKKPINLIKRISNFVSGKGFNPYEEVYDYVYSSRTVIKNKYINQNVTPGFYGVDVWEQADKYLKPYLIKGMTIYAEIVGFLPNGGWIQKNYDYGCIPPKEGEIYTPEKHFKVRVYRITLTNVDGLVHEFSPREVQVWCETHGLKAVPEFYYGYAKDLYPDIIQDENWFTNFLNRLADDKKFYMELDSPDCNNPVPHEGIVIKQDKMRSEAWKLKTFRHIDKIEQKALDAGEIDIEDNA